MIYNFVYNIIDIKLDFSRLKRKFKNQEFVLIASSDVLKNLTTKNYYCVEDIHNISRNFHSVDYDSLNGIIQSYVEKYKAQNIKLLTNEDSAQINCAKLRGLYNLITPETQYTNKPRLNLENHFEIMKMLPNIMPYVFWKDRQGKYLGCNLIEAKEFNINSISEFVGKTAYEILEDTESARLIEEVDNAVMDSGKIIIVEERLQTPEGLKTYLSQKQPIYNKNGEVVGLLGCSMDITQIKEQERLAKEEDEKEQKKFSSFIENISHLIDNYKISALNRKLGKSELNTLQNKPNLTKREAEVLYYLSLNKSPKEIAAILSLVEQKEITSKTIQSVIDKQLYSKFKVYSISQLIENAKSKKLIPFLLDN